MGYSTGVIGSMALSKSRPRFEDIYTFPEEPKVTEQKEDAELYKLRMLVWAKNMNAIDKQG